MKLLMIHTGGTLMMRGADPMLALHDLSPQELLTELPVLRKIAEIESTVLCNLDSSDMQPHHWVALAERIDAALPHYDGVVVIHGTDTMAYTASALAFLLPGLDRSVVLTGAQKPLSEVRTDARANLVDACLMATRKVPEVGIAFDSKLLRGCRATKLDAWGMTAFASPCCAPLAELGLDVELGPHVLPARARVAFDARLETRVLSVRTVPGLDPEFVRGALARGVKGVLIEAFGAGNVPVRDNSLVPVIEEAVSRDVPVVVVSQCPRGSVDLTRYEGGVRAARAGAVGAGDMTAEAALAKLMVVLGRAPEGRLVQTTREAFGTAWAGEMSV